MAFVALMKMFDGEREANLLLRKNAPDTSIFSLDYMNNVFGAAEVIASRYLRRMGNANHRESMFGPCIENFRS